MGDRLIQRWRWCLLLCLVTAQAVAGPLGLPDSARPGAVRPEEVGKQTVPAKPPASTLKVPPVIDRPFEIDEGPRVVVNRFRLLDARDLPEFNITLDEVQQLLQGLIEKKPEGFTIGQLQEVSDAVTKYYREKGLILAQSVVPVQTVQTGTVDIQVFEGKLGRILAEGNKMYSEEMLRKPFKHLIGKPVTKDAIESALLTLTDFPGLSVFGVFQPGRQVGTADILLKVQNEKHFDVSYRIDNHGLTETGTRRFRPELVWNNPTGGADRLSITLQQTYHPKNNLFRTFNYEHYLANGFTAGLTINRNSFDVGGDLAAQQIFGQTDQQSLFLQKSWIRSRQLNLSSTFTVERKQSKTTVRQRRSNVDRLSVFTLGFDFDNVDTRFKGINFATLEINRGVNNLFGAMSSSGDALNLPAGLRPSRQGGPSNPKFAAGQFTSVNATASRLQTLRPNLSLLLRAEYQWSKDLLVPLQQYSVGGPDNVRSFPQAQQLLDRALFVSAEFIQNMPFITDVPAFANRTWGELIQLSAFFDEAIGRLNSPLQSDPQGYVKFRGAGVQVRFTLPSLIESRLMWAWEVGSDEADNGRRPQIWGDFTYRF